MNARHESWPLVMLMVACLTAIAASDNNVPVADPFWWPVLYGSAAAALLAWQVTKQRWLLTAFGAVLCTASVARGLAFMMITDRNFAAAGVHGMMALFAVLFVRNRTNGGSVDSC